MGLLRNTIFCHSRESGNPERFNFNRLIDTRFHGYDGFNLFRNSPKIDRLSRRLKDLIEIVEELSHYDVGFKSITELIDTTTPEGRLMFHQFGSFAQYEC